MSEEIDEEAPSLIVHELIDVPAQIQTGNGPPIQSVDEKREEAAQFVVPEEFDTISADDMFKNVDLTPPGDNNDVPPDAFSNIPNIEQNIPPMHTQTTMDNSHQPRNNHMMQNQRPAPQPPKHQFQQSAAPMKQKNRYHIIELFCLMNPTIKNGLRDGEAAICNIAFNIDFGNLRFTFSELTDSALDHHVLFQQSLLRMTAGTAYPASLFKLQHTIKNYSGEEPVDIVCMEQLLVNTGERWQSERPRLTFRVEQDKVTLWVIDPKIKIPIFYEFSDWQKETLLHATDFAINKGFELTGQANIQG